MTKKSIFVLLLKLERRLGNRGFGSIPGVQPLKKLLLQVMVPRHRVVAEVGGFKMYLSPKDTGISRELLSAGDYEQFEIELFRSVVKSGMVVLDVGANIGYYSLAAAQQSGDGAKIYSFEPEPSVMAMFRDNIKLNGYRSIEPVATALADKKGTLRLNVDAANLGKHSLVAADNSSQQIEIQTTTVDDFVRERSLARIDLIKLDVEGAEGMVLAGAMDAVARFKPLVFMEYTPDWLVRAGTDARKLFADFERLGYVADLIDTRERRLRRVDFAELERLRASTTWTFQANLILSQPASP